MCSHWGFCDNPIIIIDSDTQYVQRVLKDTPPRKNNHKKNAARPLKILVVTDTHMDFDYIEVFSISYSIIKGKKR